MVGLGNPLHGDDGVGLIVAQSVFEILRRKSNIDLLECPVLDARLAECLVGYERAVIIDALIDAQAKVGTVSRVEVAKPSGDPPASLHATGFQDVLALAQMVGMAVPEAVQVYGVVIREPRRFSQGLSTELAAKLSEISTRVVALVEPRRPPGSAPESPESRTQRDSRLPPRASDTGQNERVREAHEPLT